jgi:hypothetical protein
MKRHDGCAFFGFDGQRIIRTVLFPKKDMDRFDNVVTGFVRRADRDLVIAAIASAENHFFKFHRKCDFTFCLGSAINPTDVHGGAAFKLTESLAKRFPILTSNFNNEW